jgi:hypothetical protein
VVEKGERERDIVVEKGERERGRERRERNGKRW